MIFPDVSAEEWIKKYPALEVYVDRCDFCRRKMVADIPFLDKNWAGLMSQDCRCGKGKAISAATPRSTEVLEAMQILFR